MRRALACGVAAMAIGAAAAARLATMPNRWQLVPVIAGAGLVGAALLARALPRPARSRRVVATVRTGAAAAGALSLLAAAVLLPLMPLDFLPPPTGAYRVGTTVLSLTDPSRTELPQPAVAPAARTLTVQLWYPAAPDATGPLEPYLRDPDALAGVHDAVGMPRFVLRYLSEARTHAVTDAAPAAAPDRFPVVVALTGNLGYRQSQTVQAEELASHGYVVVGIDQPGTVASALLLDGRRVPYAGAAALRPVIDQAIEPVTPAPLLHGASFPDGLAPYLAADPAFVLDRLAAGDGPAALAGRLDLTRVGGFGMSLGGYVVSQWCAIDDRVRACMFLDAPMTVTARERGLRVPAAWLTRPADDMAREGWSERDVRLFDGTQRELFAAASGPAWYVTVDGLRHADLSDAPYGSPLLAATGATSTSGRHVPQLMQAVTLAFFERALRGVHDGPTTVLDRPPWPDVTVTSRP